MTPPCWPYWLSPRYPLESSRYNFKLVTREGSGNWEVLRCHFQCYNSSNNMGEIGIIYNVQGQMWVMIFHVQRRRIYHSQIGNRKQSKIRSGQEYHWFHLKHMLPTWDGEERCVLTCEDESGRLQSHRSSCSSREWALQYRDGIRDPVSAARGDTQPDYVKDIWRCIMYTARW